MVDPADVDDVLGAAENAQSPASDLPEELAGLTSALLTLRGPEAGAYRLLAGEYLVLAVEIERALDLILSFWFIEMDQELFDEFDTILQRMGLDKKLQAVKRLVRNDPSKTGAVLARADRVQRLRNKIAHQSPRIDGGVVQFNDEALTPAQFEAEIMAARELTLELLDGLFPLVVDRRGRWGARDIDGAD